MGGISMRRVGLFVFSLLIACGPVTAQNAAVIYGAGSNTCGTYLEDRAKIPSAGQVYAAWVYGLISGHNLFAAGNQVRREKIEEAAIVAYLDKECREEPFSSVVTAAFKLISELGGRRPSTR
jgi:hypothetical protein